MPNLIVIFGPPASGKAAVGHALAKLIGYRFFHNHLTADPAAALFGWGTERFGRAVDAIREILFREVAGDDSVSGVIFTFVWGLELPEDTEMMEKVAAMFTESGGAVHFIELRAALQARIQREGTPFRVSLKSSQRDVEAARIRQVELDAKYRMNTEGKLSLNFPHLIIDTEAHKPEQAARKILKFIGGSTNSE
jgi:hypothetical protein